MLRPITLLLLVHASVQQQLRCGPYYDAAAQQDEFDGPPGVVQHKPDDTTATPSSGLMSFDILDAQGTNVPYTYGDRIIAVDATSNAMIGCLLRTAEATTRWTAYSNIHLVETNAYYQGAVLEHEL